MHVSIAPETIFSLFGFSLTNSLISSIVVTLLLAMVATIVGQNYHRLPRGLQHLFEMSYEMFENLAISISGEKGKRFVPLATTIFLFVICSNWIGLLPGVGSILYHKHPLFRGASADLNTTFALALISVSAANIYSIRQSGLYRHLAHFKNPLEIISEISKILSFGFRLFGNVFAGEILLSAAGKIAVLIANQEPWYFGLIGGIIQVPFLSLEIFVGFIQAFIFSVLTLVFIGVYTENKNH